MADLKVKISEFPLATEAKDSDDIAILQDGVNKRIKTPKIEEKILDKSKLYADNNFINKDKLDVPNGVATLGSDGKLSENQRFVVDINPSFIPIDLTTPPSEVDGVFLPTTSGVYVNYGGLSIDLDLGSYLITKIGDTYKSILLAVESTLIANNIEDLRSKEPAYEGQIITLLGYYEAGDKESLNYKWTSEQGVDDGGSVINTESGSWYAIFNEIVDIRDFGIIYSGDLIDVGEKLQKCLDTGINSIIFSGGEFISNVPLNVNPKTKKINGYGFKLFYNKPQSDSALNSESCFNIVDNDILDVDGINLEYTGTFDLGTSYAGIICGFRITNSNNIKLTNNSAKKFNYTGCIVGGDRPYTSVPYCNDIDILYNDFSNNRVAGIYHGNTKNLKMLGNNLTYNGKDTDPGTGYGTAGMSTLIPINTIISNNICSYNVRKGVDFHAGKDTIITNNIIEGNGLFGISYDTNSEIGKVVISGNQISKMVIDGSKSPTPFTYGYPLYIGSYDGQLTYDINSNIIITDNIITDCNCVNNGSMSVIRLLVHGLKTSSINISNNIVDVGDITCFIEQRNTAVRPGEVFDLYLSNNTFKSKSVTVTNAFNLTSSLCRNLIVENNIIEIREEYTPGVVIAITASIKTDWTKKIQGNVFNVLKIGNWASYLPFTLIGNNKEFSFRNYQNSALLRDWNGYGFLDFGNSPPTTLTYFKNSIRYNNDIGTNSPIGWVCVANGTPGTWQEFGRNARIGGNSGQRPSSPVLGQMYYSTTKARPEWFNGTDWVDSDPSATVNFTGLVKMSINTTNVSYPDSESSVASSATDVTTLVADFNSMVAKYNNVVNLVNELKAKLNAKLTADRNSGQQSTT